MNGLDSMVLKRLLEEAADSSTSTQRRAKIQSLLAEGTYARRNKGTHRPDSQAAGKAMGIELVLDALFVELVQNRPDLLSSYYPVFALLCGDGGQGFLGAIDWSLIEESGDEIC